MMISPDKQWVFVTPPKTGGTAFQHWLKNQYKWSKCGHEHDWEIPLEETNGLHAILNVRNPYDRCISMWWWSCMDPDREPKCFLYGTGFVRYMHRLMWHRDHPDVSHTTPEVYMTQSQYLERVRAQTGAAPIVVRMDQLEDGLMKLPFADKALAKQFPRVKVSKTRPRAGAMKFYSATEEELVWEYAQEDFEQFGWERLPRSNSIRVY